MSRQANEDLLNRAYVFATQKHGDQKRASGDPYFSHPVEVAGILTDLHLDTASIATALLHDTIEDTNATFGEIQNLFGSEIADMVNGVTKMSLLELSSEMRRRQKTSVNCWLPLPAIFASYWSSWPIGCTICGRCISSNRKKNAAASRKKQWIFMRHWPVVSACKISVRAGGFVFCRAKRRCPRFGARAAECVERRKRRYAGANFLTHFRL